MVRSHTKIHVEFGFREGHRGGIPGGPFFQPSLADPSMAVIDIRYFPSGSDGDPVPLQPLLEDQWVVIGPADAAIRQDKTGPPLGIVSMRPELIEAVTAYGKRHDLAHRLRC